MALRIFSLPIFLCTFCILIFTESAHWADSVWQLRCLWISGYNILYIVCICPLSMRFFSRPHIGPQTTWSYPGLSLVYQNYVSLMGTLKTCNILMVSLMRKLKKSITCTVPCNLLMVSWWKKMRSWGPSELCPLYENLSIIFNLLMKNSVGKCISATIRIGQEIRLDLLVSNFRKGKYCPATPTTPTTTTLSRSGDTPGFWNGLNWRALAESGPPNIGKLRGYNFFGIFFFFFLNYFWKKSDFLRFFEIFVFLKRAGLESSGQIPSS